MKYLVIGFCLLVSGLVMSVDVQDVVVIEQVILVVFDEYGIVEYLIWFVGVFVVLQLFDGCIIVVVIGYVDWEVDIVMCMDYCLLGGLMGKIFVVVVLMVLVEDGCVVLDDCVVQYLVGQDWFDLLFNVVEVMLE